MKKRVKISELKNHLSEYLRHVRRGHTVEVLDRDTPVASIVPSKGEQSKLTYLHRADSAKHLGDRPLPPPLRRKLPIDPVDLLREDRDKR